MNTANCLKSKMFGQDRETQLKQVEKITATCDASLNFLKDENGRLQKTVQNQIDKGNDITEDKTTSIVSVFHITITYTILLMIIGLFYNSLLTSSVSKILNENIKLVDFLNVENNFNYNLIWTKLRSCLNNFRFYLFIVIFTVSLLVNVGVIYKIILNGKNAKKALIVVSMSSVAVVGVTSLLTNNVAFNSIFENTLGYAVTKLFSPKKDHTFYEFMNGLFVHDTFEKSGVDFSFLFTAFRLDNLGDIIRDIGAKNPLSKYNFHIKTDNGLDNELNKDLNLLAKAVVMKNTIGNITWSLFSMITSTIISYKYLYRNL